MTRQSRGILVTGGGTFLGDNIASALLAEGAQVSLLVPAGSEDKLGPLAQHTRWSTADVWDAASLRGKARSHAAVIHTVGSLRADPTRGLSYRQLNFVSARNIANMCVSDGVTRIILLSGVSAPWISRQYIKSKREAESYLRRSGLHSTIIRAPLAYMPGQSRPFFYRAISWLGKLPPLSWLYFGRVAPIPIDVLALGVARIAISAEQDKEIYYAGDLRARVKRRVEDSIASNMEDFLPQDDEAGNPFESFDENLPFAWSPNDERS